MLDKNTIDNDNTIHEEIESTNNTENTNNSTTNSSGTHNLELDNTDTSTIIHGKNHGDVDSANTEDVDNASTIGNHETNTVLDNTTNDNDNAHTTSTKDTISTAQSDSTTQQTVNSGIESGNNNNEDDTLKPTFGARLSFFFHSWRAIVSVIIILACVAVPFIWVKGIQPAIDRSRIKEGPLIQRSNAPIIPYAHKWVKTNLDTSKVDANVNTTQYLLKWKSKEARSSSCMMFHAKGEDNPKHTVKVTMAFDDAKSRDFFNAQAPVLEQAMRSGKVKVQVCMLLTKNEYSALAIEALGEIDYNNPSNTWDAMLDLLKVDVSGLTDSDKRLNAIMNVVNSLPQSSAKVTIRKESLKNGSFLQWARVMSNASQVEKIPALWIDDDNLSSIDKFRINNPDALFNKIENLR